MTVPGVFWWRVITDLERGGYSHAAIGAAIGLSRTGIEGWKNRNVEPRHEDGERLIALWQIVTGLARSDLPLQTERTFSAAKMR